MPSTIEQVHAALEHPDLTLQEEAVIKWQFRLYGDFFTALFGAIVRADDRNLANLALGFPIEVAGFLEWNRGGMAQRLRARGLDI